MESNFTNIALLSEKKKQNKTSKHTMKSIFPKAVAEVMMSHFKT